MNIVKHFVILSFIFVLICSGLTLQTNAQTKIKLSEIDDINGKSPTKSAAFDWLDIALEATAREHERVAPRPTVGSRMLMIITTSMYDAWAAYDKKAVGTRLGGTLRRPQSERTEANKRTAIAYATYRAMLDLFADDKQWLDEQMRKNGYDPNNNTKDATTPEGIGNVAAAALIEYRHADGANQLGDEEGSNGKPYSDYTFYRPINSQTKITDPDCWQPIEFTLADSRKVTPGFLTPHWYRVKTFGLERSDMFRPGPPPKIGSEELKKEVDEVIMYNSSLTLEQKAIVEFMRDGPRSTGQSGHWLRLAQAVSLRDKNDTDKDVKMYFAVGVATFDAFIASWEAKRYYDSSRPWTLIRYYYKDQKIRGWGGVGKGVATIPAEEWHPYSPLSFITPPFPGYVSGHSTVSAAGAKILELYTKSDFFGATEQRHPGEMTEEGISCELKQSFDGKPGATVKGDGIVTLKMPTFSAAAEMAGLSRVMGGYHIQADNIAGLELGRKVSNHIFPKIESYFNGTAGKMDNKKMTAAR